MSRFLESSLQSPEKHFFVLAFENSVCVDYVTEKFWRMKHLIVPIVLQRSIAAPHAPAGSFIAADDFDGPDTLAQYLKELMNNRTRYKESALVSFTVQVL